MGAFHRFQAEGSQNAECDGAQFENQVRYSQYKFGEVGEVGSVKGVNTFYQKPVRGE